MGAPPGTGVTPTGGMATHTPAEKIFSHFLLRWQGRMLNIHPSLLPAFPGLDPHGKALRAGVKIFERRGVILHSKTALIDGVWATVGSTNLDWRSFLHNHELNAVVLGAEFGRQVQAMFDKDLAASNRIQLEAWQQRPIDQRLMEQFARAWEYWL